MIPLELVVDAESDNALINLADDGVAILEIDTEVVGELIFYTCSHIDADVVLLVGREFLSIDGAGRYFGH